MQGAEKIPQRRISSICKQGIFLQRSSWGEIWISRGVLERVNGIEPSYAAWEAAVLPLNYTRV